MKVHIIGLGATARDFTNPLNEITIGVNDVTGCDWTVCVDRISAFTPERFETMWNNVAGGIFTHLPEWGEYHRGKMAGFLTRKIELKNISAFNSRWNEFIPSSNNSPFVACGVAFIYFAATEIYLWGCDYNNHPHLNGAMREKTVIDFILLQKELNKKGCVIYPHRDSYLHGKI